MAKSKSINKVVIIFGILLLFGIKTKGFFGWVKEYFDKLTLLPIHMLLIGFAVIFVIMLISRAVSSEPKKIHSLLSSMVFGMFMLSMFWILHNYEIDLEEQTTVILKHVMSFGPLVFLVIVDGILSGLDGKERKEAHIFKRLLFGISIAVIYVFGAGNPDTANNSAFYGAYGYYLITLWAVSQFFIQYDEIVNTLPKYINELAVLFGLLLLFGIKTKGFGHLEELFDEKFTLLSIEMLLVCFAVIFVVMLIARAVSSKPKEIHSLLSSVVFGMFMLCTFWLFQNYGMDDLEGQLEAIMGYVVSWGPPVFLAIVDGIISGFEGIDMEDAHIFKRIGTCFGIMLIYFNIFFDDGKDISAVYSSYCYYLIVLWVASQIFIYYDDAFTAHSSSDDLSDYVPSSSSSSSNYSSSSDSDTIWGMSHEEWTKKNDDLDAVQSALGPDFFKDV